MAGLIRIGIYAFGLFLVLFEYLSNDRITSFLDFINFSTTPFLFAIFVVIFAIRLREQKKVLELAEYCRSFLSIEYCRDLESEPTIRSALRVLFLNFAPELGLDRKVLKERIEKAYWLDIPEHFLDGVNTS